MSELNINKDKEKKKIKNPTLAIQSIVCAVLVIAVFALGKSSASLYSSIKNGYTDIMKEDLCSNGILSAARELFYLTFGKTEQVDKKETFSETSSDTYTQSATAEIESFAEVETITSSGGEDIKVLDALCDSTLDAVHISTEAVTPVNGTVTSEFGYRIHPITGNKSFHTGIDIAAPEGTAISSAYNGIVTQTGYTYGKGNYVLIEHSENLQTLYCHLSEILVSEGVSLLAGETLGLVGSTGMSTGPHLHFELRVGGIRCNPIYALRDFANEV